MPLLDHFHPPLAPLHSWESFHSRWANAIADALDRNLPGRFFAEVQVHWGTQIEADVAEFEWSAAHEGPNGAGGGVAVQTWAPPAAVHSLPLVFPDEVEVRVFDLRGGGKRLVGVIELISPGNKDTAETRRAFAAKCVAYLHRGIGLIAVDVVTRRHANLHNELLQMLGQAQAVLPPEVLLYAVAYAPARRDDANLFDLWPVPLAVGRPLPLLPLALRGAFFVPVDLEATYTEARQRCRL
jgi:hypothetical protein